MMNWCSRHNCFEICPYCMAELQQRSPLRDTTAERHPPKILVESNPGTPADPRASQGEECEHGVKPPFTCEQCMSAHRGAER